MVQGVSRVMGEDPLRVNAAGSGGSHSAELSKARGGNGWSRRRLGNNLQSFITSVGNVSRG